MKAVCEAFIVVFSRLLFFFSLSMVVRDLGKVVLIVMMGFDVFLMLILLLTCSTEKGFRVPDSIGACTKYFLLDLMDQYSISSYYL